MRKSCDLDATIPDTSRFFKIPQLANSRHELGSLRVTYFPTTITFLARQVIAGGADPA